MRNILLIFLVLFSVGYADEPATVDSVENYNAWGWKAFVMQNGLITAAVIPAIGARIMQYDLGTHSSIFINENLLGDVLEPDQNDWHNYGGFKNWPAPQDVWSWPPPAQLDAGVYTCKIVINSQDSVSIMVSSPRETWNKTPDLRFERRITLYRGSTLLKVEQTLINERSSSQNWSVWDITQNKVQHGDEGDYSNFWVYLPINPDSKFGSDGVNMSASSDAWQGEVAPGIYGVQFLPDDKKLFVDSHEGWNCYVDERDSIAFAKTFSIYEGETYPDNGAHNEVWIGSGLNSPPYVEVEVVSPIVSLPANGGRYTFTEEWWTAKIPGPILGVNGAGAILQKLQVNDALGKITGKFGIFYLGTAQVIYLNENMEVIGQGPEHAVTPLEMFTLDDTISKPEGTMGIALRIKDSQGNRAGDVDMIDYGISGTKEVRKISPDIFTLFQNYPNPFNPETIISFELQKPSVVELVVFDLTGKKIKTLALGLYNAGSHQLKWRGDNESGRNVTSGVYFYRLKSSGLTQTRKMILIR